MAAIIGAHTILQKALPTGWDASRIVEWQMRGGRTFGEVIGDLAAAVAAWNQSVVDAWGWSFYVTDEIAFEYEQGSTIVAARPIGDVGRNETSSESTIGHMIDMLVYQESIGGSKRAFKRLRESQFAASINGILRAFSWRFEIELLSRIMLPTETLLGSGGYNVGWVNGGSGNVDYIPAGYDGEAFDATHDHYVGVNSASNDHGDLLNTLVETVQEHGYNAPFRAVVSKADLASYLALGDEWVKVVDPVVQMIERGGTTTGATMFNIGRRPRGMAGYFQSNYGLVEVHYTQRLDTGYAAVLNSAGTNVAGNPIGIRVDPDEGFGARIVPETTDDTQYPVKKVDVEMEFGVGLNGQDPMVRTAGAAGYLVSGGAWVNPTID